MVARLLVAVAIGLGVTAPSGALAVARQPSLVLWAWERPEDFTFIDPSRVAVAYLARTVYMTADRVTVKPRLQPLAVPDGTQLTAVVRLEAAGDAPALSDHQQRLVAGHIADVARAGIAGVQIDFDATASQRAFYRGLIADVRQRLPAGLGLSITALASWCTGDPWLSALPIDDAVPMLFRMGTDAAAIRRQLREAGRFTAPRCQESVGVSTDERIALSWMPRRLYVFNPRPWTAAAMRDVEARFQQ